MKKTCPICDKPYTETAWRKTKAGGYRAFRHLPGGLNWKTYWCRGQIGQHFTLMVVLGAGK